MGSSYIRVASSTLSSQGAQSLLNNTLALLNYGNIPNKVSVGIPGQPSTRFNIKFPAKMSQETRERFVKRYRGRANITDKNAQATYRKAENLAISRGKGATYTRTTANIARRDVSINAFRKLVQSKPEYRGIIISK